ncbi:hypothetical protein QSU92_10935 [Microbacterium sp. ET2]|uniref:hypothetical protein n=1 Tax=Microbacterium albipurpureum TaxID=3050384 RepID=UPI00259CC5DE|nr:hypothetical protein [Microbacterium sp. ET2 (Ac-2212)]WJL94487.1 hypothetical protein QSU92_10935 [Microbacterium sp. ET2 (Ac-2212)]
MPRSSVVLTPDPVDATAIGRAAASVHDRVSGGDAPFELRPLDDGAVLQVIADGVVVLSVLRPRLVPEVRELARVLPGVTPPETTRWWTEAYTPWHAGGSLGVAILDALDGIAVHGGVGPARED